MTIETLINELQLSQFGDKSFVSWERSETSYLQGDSFFYNQSYITQVCHSFLLAPEISDVLIASLEHFKQYPLLERLAWHYHTLIKEELNNENAPLEWPLIGVLSEAKRGLLQLITALSLYPDIKRLYSEKNLPNELLHLTMSDIDIWMRYYKELHGEWGFPVWGWIIRHFKGKIFRLGRLQFEFSHWFLPTRVYRHKDGNVVVLIEGGHKLRSDGQFFNADSKQAESGVWESILVESDEHVQAFPIMPQGHVQNRLVKLSKKVWQEIFKSGDPYLNVHIPSGEPMDFDACGRSYLDAFRFFPKFFPDFKYKAFGCYSWLLDIQFAKFLSPSSNVVRFLKEYYLLPVSGAHSKPLMDRVFHAKMDTPLSELPQKSSMQIALVQAMQQGVSFRAGAFVIFEEDFNWGSAVYQNMKMPI
jgi:hypothetical protein